MVTLRDARLVAIGCADRELDFDLAALQLARQLEPERLEDAEHVAVVREHECDEALDASRCRPLGKLLDESSSDPATLIRVCNGEGRLGDRRLAQADVAPDRDDALPAVLRERPE